MFNFLRSEFKVWPLAILVKVGDSAKISANQIAHFTSNDSNIATVDVSGQVIARRAGKATIDVKNDKGEIKVVVVTVESRFTEEPPAPTPPPPLRSGYPCAAGGLHDKDYSGTGGYWCRKCGCLLRG